MFIPLRQKPGSKLFRVLEQALKSGANPLRSYEVVRPRYTILLLVSVPAELPDLYPNVTGSESPAVVLALVIVIRTGIQVGGDESQDIASHIAGPRGTPHNGVPPAKSFQSPFFNEVFVFVIGIGGNHYLGIEPRPKKNITRTEKSSC
jgi:hypothetical protein